MVDRRYHVSRTAHVEGRVRRCRLVYARWHPALVLLFLLLAVLSLLAKMQIRQPSILLSAHVLQLDATRVR